MDWSLLVITKPDNTVWVADKISLDSLDLDTEAKLKEYMDSQGCKYSWKVFKFKDLSYKLAKTIDAKVRELNTDDQSFPVSNEKLVNILIEELVESWEFGPRTESSLDNEPAPVAGAIIAKLTSIYNGGTVSESPFLTKLSGK